MIHYQLRCENDDEFEGWFASIAEFERQAEGGLIECPHCHSTKACFDGAGGTNRTR
jgi:hypothetical protein